MESWRLVLRQGFLPQWTTSRIKEAVAALEADDRRLTQGSTTTPPPLMAVQDWPVEACDLIAFCSSDDAFSATVGDIEEGFARACFNADQTLGEPAACRWFLNWFDDEPRGEVFRECAAELRAEIERRRPVEAPTELRTALANMPEDSTLKRAVYDWCLEAGGTLQDAERESGWKAEQEDNRTLTPNQKGPDQ